MGEIIEIKATYEKLTHGELTAEELCDLEEALMARDEASAPYSNFLVGACLRTNDEKTVHDWNVEYIDYIDLHAEENAVGNITRKSRLSGLKRVTVVGAPRGQDSQDAVTPCGSCRQKSLEVIRPGDNPQVIMAGVRGEILRANLRDLLPLGFFPASVKR